MNLELKNIGKRYNFEWIFRKVNQEFAAGEHTVILGSNGSGKSTLLQVIAGNLTHSEGAIELSVQSSKIDADDHYKYVSIAAPYLELFEEFTLAESIGFQSKFKHFRNGLTTEEVVGITGLEKSKDKQLKYFSSGMKQRVRLVLAVLADTPLLLLDEPTSNLDKKAIDWYQSLVTSHSNDRLILVASNQQEQEYPFCKRQINIEEYK
ncbi:MAG: ATP-binding cassette domain-containing protein [Bacteroidia bacterium]